MQAHNKGRDVLVVFEDVGAALATACGLDCDGDAVHLAHAAQIVQRQMFREAKPFNGFPERCQEESIPSLLLGLVSMILAGPSTKDQMADTTPAALRWQTQPLLHSDGRHNPCCTQMADTTPAALRWQTQPLLHSDGRHNPCCTQMADTTPAALRWQTQPLLHLQLPKY